MRRMTGPEPESDPELVSIGEFARLSQLSPKALRIYAELGLLTPAQVDPYSGYRWYATGQLDRARLIASLRAIGVPLATIGPMLAAGAADRAVLAAQVRDWWAAAEVAHDARRVLAGYLASQLTGERSVMYEVATRQIPERTVLCLKRNVDPAGAWALGKEFVAIMRDRPVPGERLPGRAGAAFSIYHGEVSEDSDGPVEWCRPVPAGQAAEIAAKYPELTLRTEPAHEEAFVHLGDTQGSPPQWRLVMEALFGWGARNGREASDLGIRITYRFQGQNGPDPRPDCDYAVPLS
ncbi:MAG TPA: MerR family transcriptional regulator [Streptosporangiaceae bacterium]